MINTIYDRLRYFFVFMLMLGGSIVSFAQHKHEKWTIRVMEYNVENLFDCQHDTLKDDYEYLPEGSYKWTRGKYWKKLNSVARGIVLASSSTGTFIPPDLIGLCEVENDTVMYDLTHKSLLRGAGYEYVMTNSLDSRGVDVALLYQPVSFRYINHYGLRVDTVPGMRQTRDILYVKGEIKASAAESISENTQTSIKTVDNQSKNSLPAVVPLHVFVVHAPSRRGGEKASRPYRLAVIDRLIHSIDSVRSSEPDARMIVMGDFNDYDGGHSLRPLLRHDFSDVTTSKYITPDKSVKGTYRYQGEWGSLDHIFVSDGMLRNFICSFIANNKELLEQDNKYGGVKPFRFFRGPVLNGGYSDHLPLIADFSF